MAETSGYFHAAYIVAGVLYVGYVVSLFARRRTTRARLAALAAANAPPDSQSGERLG